MEVERQPTAYPGTGTGTGTETGASHGINSQTEYSNLGFQTGSQAFAFPPPAQPYTIGQQQAMMNNTMVIGGMDGMQTPLYPNEPEDYTLQAWIACLCCFWPTGILAIMKASESRDAVVRGDLFAANIAANSARQMIKVTFIIGIVIAVCTGVFSAIYYGITLR